MSETVTRVVTGPQPVPGRNVDPTTHTYAWSTVDPTGAPGAKLIHTANYGDVIEISPEEAARGERLGVLSTPEQAAAILGAAGDPAGEWEPASDDAIAAMSVEQVHAYLSTVPEELSEDEIDRVVELEQQRPKPRQGVLAYRDDNEE